MNKIIYLLPLLLCIACGEKKTTEPTANSNEKPVQGTLTIAVINTDSILSNFDMFIDKQDEIEKTNTKLSSDLERQMNNLKADYDNYLKVGATMTLSEQQKKEAQLQRRQQEIATLEQKYTEQLVNLRTQTQIDLTNAIYDFIEKYNKEHDNYSLIISKSRTGGGAALYADPSMDITVEVLQALNEHYSQTKKK